MRLERHVALVTGGGSGIGESAVRMLAAEGCRVAVMGRRREPLDALKKELGESILALAGDVSSADDCRRAVVETVKHFGRLTILVNNAGAYTQGPLAETKLDSFRHIMEINVFGPMLLSGLAGEAMKQAGEGSIINVSSTLGQKAVPNVSLYSASKAALIMLTRTTAMELAPYKIRCNCVSPAVIRTPIHGQEEGTPEADAYWGQMAPMHPLGRVGEAGEVARAILFFALPENHWITGTILPVDGGMTAA